MISLSHTQNCLIWHTSLLRLAWLAHKTHTQQSKFEFPSKCFWTKKISELCRLHLHIFTFLTSQKYFPVNDRWVLSNLFCCLLIITAESACTSFPSTGHLSFHFLNFMKVGKCKIYISLTPRAFIGIGHPATSFTLVHAVTLFAYIFLSFLFLTTLAKFHVKDKRSERRGKKDVKLSPKNVIIFCQIDVRQREEWEVR